MAYEGEGTKKNVMFKIGDFSQIGQISVRMLRYYDNMGLLKPRHVDESSGYRYYTLDQLPRLNRIAALKDLGLTLQQITELLAEDLPLERLHTMLKHKQEEIQRHLHEEMARLTRSRHIFDAIQERPSYQLVAASLRDCPRYL